MRVSYNGSTGVSKTSSAGSIPAAPATSLASDVAYHSELDGGPRSLRAAFVLTYFYIPQSQRDTNLFYKGSTAIRTDVLKR